MRGFKKLQHVIFPKVAADEPQQTRIASHRVALQTMAVVGVLTSVYLYLNSELTRTSGLIFGIGFLLYIATTHLYRAGKSEASKWMMVASIWTSFTLFLFFTGCIDQFVFIGYFVTVLISGMFLDDLQTYLLIAASALSAIGLVLALRFSEMLSGFLGEVNIPILIFQIIFLLLAALVGRTLARELQSALHRLVALSQKAQAIFQLSNDAIFITDLDFRITELNLQAQRLLDLPQEKALGKRLLEFVPEGDLRKIDELIGDVVSNGGISDIELCFKTEEQDDRCFLVSSNLILGEVQHPDHIQVIVQDITSRKQAEQLVQRLAMQDHLTKVDNRLSLQYRLNSLVVQKKRTGEKFSLVYFDLDNFKAVNDKYGHQVGDQLLIAFTKRLSGAIRQGDFLARVGGDEFVLILDYHSTPEDLESTLKRIRKSLSTPFKIKTHLIPLYASYGISHFPEDGEEADSLLRLADSAMYSSKNI